MFAAFSLLNILGFKNVASLHVAIDELEISNMNTYYEWVSF